MSPTVTLSSAQEAIFVKKVSVWGNTVYLKKEDFENPKKICLRKFTESGEPTESLYSIGASFIHRENLIDPALIEQYRTEENDIPYLFLLMEQKGFIFPPEQPCSCDEDEEEKACQQAWNQGYRPYTQGENGEIVPAYKENQNVIYVLFFGHLWAKQKDQFVQNVKRSGKKWFAHRMKLPDFS